MTTITASDVSKLRQQIGAGMMDCKNALQEAEGDFDKAIEIIRKKGQAVANKRADRAATEGVVLAKVSTDRKKGAIIVLNCETDFVAKNENFLSFANSIIDLALEKQPSTLEELKNLELNSNKLADAITEHIGIIGEKLDLPFYEHIDGSQVVAYIHPGNNVATLLSLNKDGIEEQVGKDVAMQIAAMNPIAIDKDDVPKKVIDQEVEIGKEQAKREGKPEDLLEKIAIGKLNKYFKENTLLNQEFIKDGKKTVKQYLQEQDKDLTVMEFFRYSLRD